MNNIELIKSLGPDIDLLTRSEVWLQTQLTQIKIALQIKRRLQQQNLVVVRMNQQGHNYYTVQPIAAAVRSLAGEMINSTLPIGSRSTNMFAQLAAWESDGFDISSSCTGK